MTLVLFDDSRARDFHPFVLTRPVGELRAGAQLIRERWELAVGEQASGFISANHLADFDEPWAPSSSSGTLPAGTVVVDARCAVALEGAPHLASIWRCGDRVAAVRLGSAVAVSEIVARDSLAELPVGTGVEATVRGWWLEEIWDLVRYLPEMLADDIPRLAQRLGCVPAAVERLGDAEVYVEPGARAEPGIVFDTSGGPILLRAGSVVQAPSRLEGPLLVGTGTVVRGGRLAVSSLGDDCRVHGEVSHSIFLGHCNKAHDGFIGHSVLGRWVNLGAGTIGSNLKNTYGTVVVWTPGGPRDTGMQFLGAFLGDHSKTAIGTRLTTGAVVGAGANVYGDGLSPKYIPPFSWGMDGRERWDVERFLVTAQRAMQRRNVPLSERARKQLARAWAVSRGT